MPSVDEIPPARGPAAPSAGAAVTHRPLGGQDVRLDHGLLHNWQQRNAVASLPLALRQLEAAGNLANLRLAIAGGTEGYQGPVFMDSDLYKVLEAVGWELGRSQDQDQELASFLAEATALLEKAQQPDGYLNSYMQVTGRSRYSFLASSHEMYCAGHLIQAAIACHRGAGDPGLLRVAQRFADHLVNHFLGREEGIDGHPIVETALAELYRETGHEPYLRLASQFIEQRGHGMIGDSGFGRRYLQDHEPVRETTTEVGHAVRALYLEAGVADVAAEAGDADLLQTSLTRWADMIAAKTYLTGGNGSRHEGESFGDHFELPPDRAYNETCAAIASFQWAWRLLLATGDSAYADLMERILYNGFASSTATDGTRFFYVNPLQRRPDHFEKDDPGRRREWFSCACCPPNIMRTMASLQHYLATTSSTGTSSTGTSSTGTSGTLYVHQFTGATLSAPLAGGVLAVQMVTDYPWSGVVELRVLSAPAQECGLALRVPAWGALPPLLLNDHPAEAGATPGYLVVRRRWRPGDVLRYELDISPRLTFPDSRVDAVRGCAAIERGPLVYCLEQADQAAGTELDDLTVIGGQLRDTAAAVPGVGKTVLIEADAAGAAGRDPAAITAIPYFQWDNRDGRAMRVWIPVASSPAPAPAAPGH